MKKLLFLLILTTIATTVPGTSFCMTKKEKKGKLDKLDELYEGIDRTAFAFNMLFSAYKQIKEDEQREMQSSLRMRCVDDKEKEERELVRSNLRNKAQHFLENVEFLKTLVSDMSIFDRKKRFRRNQWNRDNIRKAKKLKEMYEAIAENVETSIPGTSLGRQVKLAMEKLQRISEDKNFNLVSSLVKEE